MTTFTISTAPLTQTGWLSRVRPAARARACVCQPACVRPSRAPRSSKPRNVCSLIRPPFLASKFVCDLLIFFYYFTFTSCAIRSPSVLARQVFTLRQQSSRRHNRFRRFGEFRAHAVVVGSAAQHLTPTPPSYRRRRYYCTPSCVPPPPLPPPSSTTCFSSSTLCAAKPVPVILTAVFSSRCRPLYAEITWHYTRSHTRTR